MEGLTPQRLTPFPVIVLALRCQSFSREKSVSIL